MHTMKMDADNQLTDPRPRGRRDDTSRFFLSVTLLVGLLIPAGSIARADGPTEEINVFEQIDLLVDLRHEIVRGYVEDPDQKDMVEAAVRGMIKSLKDPYTVYLNAEDLKPFDKHIRGSFSGIGAEIDIHNGRLRIVSPLEESPSWKAGVMAGDIVLEIDGETTEDIKINQAVKRLTGPEGTVVTILVRHESGEEEEISITRARIDVQTVKGIRRGSDHHWQYILDSENGIGYIRITQFNPNTADAMKLALQELKSKDARGVILDVRFNPGGLLESAAAVSDMFLDGGQTIVSVRGRAVPDRVKTATDEATLTSMPVVIIANGASASAAEILTGALSDNGRAKFVGTRTFGKGSVQQVRMLESGRAAVKLTTAYYYIPSDRNIHRREGEEMWGVDPEDGFIVPMSSEQMREMLKTRREGDILRAQSKGVPNQDMTPDWIEQELKDFQLAAGLKAMLGRLETGDWPAVGESGATEWARLARRENLIRQRDLITERLDELKIELAELDGDSDKIEEIAVGGEDAATSDSETPLFEEPVVGESDINSTPAEEAVEDTKTELDVTAPAIDEPQSESITPESPDTEPAVQP